MTGTTIALLIFIAAALIFAGKKFYDWFNDHSVDYAFGLKEAIDIRKRLKNKQYAEAEALIAKLNADNLTQVVDCVTLSLEEEQLLEWDRRAQNKNISHLFLGVYYNHQAWLARSYGFAKDVSAAQRLGFHEYQEKSREMLMLVEDSSLLGIETDARLIRYFMGNGELGQSRKYFKKVMKQDSDNLWAHLRYAEVIQPKWGGNLDLIADLRKLVASKRPLIRQVVELKLLSDSFTISQNYSGGTMEELAAEAAQKILEIDKEVSTHPPNSIHKYVVYNYLYAVAGDLGNSRMEHKYLNKMNDYYTLYPFGIMK